MAATGHNGIHETQSERPPHLRKRVKRPNSTSQRRFIPLSYPRTLFSPARCSLHSPTALPVSQLERVVFIPRIMISRRVLETAVIVTWRSRACKAPIRILQCHRPQRDPFRGLRRAEGSRRVSSIAGSRVGPSSPSVEILGRQS